MGKCSYGAFLGDTSNTKSIFHDLQHARCVKSFLHVSLVPSSHKNSPHARSVVLQGAAQPNGDNVVALHPTCQEPPKLLHPKSDCCQKRSPKP